MEKYTGKSIFKGIAIGKILFYQKGEQPVKRVKIEDTAEQIKRYEDARAKAAEQLQGLYEKALKEVGEANAAVFEVHQMMLDLSPITTCAFLSKIGRTSVSISAPQYWLSASVLTIISAPEYKKQKVKIPKGAHHIRAISYKNGQPIGREINISIQELLSRIPQ